MKILFVTHYEELYGANKSLLGLIKGLKQFGIQSMVLVPAAGNLSKVLESDQIEHYIVPFNCGFWVSQEKHTLRDILFIARHQIFNAVHILRILYLFLNNKFDVVYSNSSVIPLGWILSRLLRKPHVWHIREFVNLHYGYKFIMGNNLSSTIVNNSELIIAISKSIKEKHALRLDKKKTHVVYNGVLFKKEFEEYKKMRIDRSGKGKSFVFSIVGVIHPSKGHHLAIEAFNIVQRKYPDITLLIAGNGNKDFLVKMLKTYNLEKKIQFWGFVENPFEIYLQSDCMLMCSRHEAFGRVTVESMACLCPVIGLNMDGTSEIIKDKYNGLLFDGTVNDLVDKMIFVIENTLNNKTLAQNAWKEAYDRFSIEEMSASIADLLRNTIKN